MKNRTTPYPSTHRRAKQMFTRCLALMCLLFVAGTPAFAQQTAGGTQIQNRASATYSDGTNNYSTISNTVTVTVSNVSGLTITPDAGTRPNAVAEQLVRFTFTVTNTGNFADQVRFLANNASFRLTGAGTIEQAFIDRGAPNGGFEAGTDISIFNTSADVISPAVAQNGTLSVAILVRVNAGATSGTINVRLGDASADNVLADSSANEVRTVATTSVNGLREATGDISMTIENDAQLLLTMTAPAGPVALSSNIAYTYQLCNPGSRAAQSVTLGGTNGVFIVVPIPVFTELLAAPAGTVLYSTSALTVAPFSATWSATAPADLATVRRVAFNVGATLATGTGACVSAALSVRITTNNATNSIFAISDAFARNNADTPVTLTDQSGDGVANGGDGNADFEEDNVAGNQGPQFDGVQQRTLLQAIGGVLLGPSSKPAAIGPTTDTAAPLYRNDDYTNKSVTAGISGVAPGGITTAANTVVFTNTVRNDGNADDTIGFTVPSVPTGFTVEISTNGGSNYTTVAPGNGTVTLGVPFGQSRDILVRVTMPAGQSVLTGYDTIVRATSTNTPSVVNDTVNRLYTGFLRLVKTSFVHNTTGVGVQSTATVQGSAVPGAEIEYIIAYENISVGTGSADNVKLTASSILITEDGNAAPNNWGATTDHVVTPAPADSRGGTITGAAPGSTLLTDAVPALGAGQSGTFTFRRRIK